ncbi:MAG: hypothetical protein FJX52_03725 [Alphaproteobacteria bacterium]|nr:hypothetical protein [Alphaproteobacteria bacterium]
MAVRNLSTGQGFATHMRIEPCVDGLRIAYATGLKTATQFRVEADDTDTANGGSVLIVTDDYSGTPAAERHARAGEIDKSIVWWGHDLHRYLKHWALCSRFRAWRWYMSRVWQPMKPQARRITFMLIAITIFELLAGAVAVAIFAFAEW